MMILLQMELFCSANTCQQSVKPNPGTKPSGFTNKDQKTNYKTVTNSLGLGKATLFPWWTLGTGSKIATITDEQWTCYHNIDTLNFDNKIFRNSGLTENSFEKMMMMTMMTMMTMMMTMMTNAMTMKALLSVTIVCLRGHRWLVGSTKRVAGHKNTKMVTLFNGI